MKGLHFHRGLLLLVLLLLAMQAMAGSQRVLIVKSSDNRFFSRSITTLIKQAALKPEFVVSTLAQLKKQPAQLANVDIMITLGIRAADYAEKVFKDKPVIHSYLTENQLQAHPQQPEHYTVLLDQPLKRYLRFIKLLLKQPTVGILRAKDHPIAAAKLQRLEQSLGIRIKQRLLSASDNPINATRNLLSISDVLLALPDPAIYNRHTLKGILLTAYRQQKPLVSYSPAQVKSGALGAVFSTPENIGRQLADLLNNMLRSPNFKPDARYYARYYDIKINRRVAEALELNIDSKENLLKQLARISYQRAR